MATQPTWTNRIIRYGEEAPDQLLAHPLNFRVHPKAQQDTLAGVLNEVGVVQNIIVNERTGRLVDGHLRVTLAMRQNQPTVPVTYVDLSPEEEALILATLDPISAMANADADKLRELLDDVSTGDAAVMAMLSEMAEREGIVDFGGTDGLTDPDDVPEPPADPITQPGDLWLLGKHRLLCGDATDPLQVDRVLNGEGVGVCLTDPPYGINAVTGKKGQWGGYADRYRPIENDHDGDVAKDVFRLTSAMKIPVQIWWGANHYCSVLPDSPCWIVWYKRDGNDGNDFADCELAWTNQTHPARLIQHQWNGFLKASEKDEKRTHPTQKPVALFEFCLNEFSKPNDLILDLFGGSGSTLIACEQAGRRCAMMELDPTYCDVIVRRWEQFTGETATRATEAMAAD